MAESPTTFDQMHLESQGCWPWDCGLCKGGEPLYAVALDDGEQVMAHESQLLEEEDDDTAGR